MGSHFRQRSDDELNGLPDDGLIDHIRLARRAGRPSEAKRALKVLVLRNVDDVRRRVRMKIPRDDVDDVTQLALMGAIASAFAGESIGEFRAWLNTIVRRRIADHLRASGPQTEALPSEHEGDEVWGKDPEGLEPDAAEVDVRISVAELIERMRLEHQVVVVLYCYMQWPAARAAEEVNRRFPDLDPPMSDNNVQQIGSRFRRDLRDHLEGG